MLTDRTDRPKEDEVNRHQRKLDGKYKDTLMMELFLT